MPVFSARELLFRRVTAPRDAIPIIDNIFGPYWSAFCYYNLPDILEPHKDGPPFFRTVGTQEEEVEVESEDLPSFIKFRKNHHGQVCTMHSRPQHGVVVPHANPRHHHLPPDGRRPPYHPEFLFGAVQYFLQYFLLKGVFSTTRIFDRP